MFSQKYSQVRQPSWYNTKQFYNNSKLTYAYRTYLKFMTTNLNNNMPVDQAALDRMFELEKKIANVI